MAKTLKAVPVVLTSLIMSFSAAATDNSFIFFQGELYKGPITLKNITAALDKYPSVMDAGNEGPNGQTGPTMALSACMSSIMGPCELDVVDFLVNKGADPNHVGKNTKSSILGSSMATASMYWGIAVTETPGMKPPVPLDTIKTPRDHYLELVKRLLAAGATPDGVYIDGSPPLFAAANLGSDFVEVLMDAGADPALAIEWVERELKTYEEVKTMFDAVSPQP